MNTNKVAAPLDDTRIGESIPKSPNRLSRSSRRYEPCHSAGERSQEILERDAMPRAEEEVQVTPGIGRSVHADAELTCPSRELALDAPLIVRCA